MALHIPVLAEEVIDNLNIKPDGIYVDGTAGYGGHSSLILEKLSSKGKLVCIDQDENAVEYLKNKFANNKNVTIVKDNFIQILDIIKYKVDGILLDIGVSSPMLDNPERGFSYHNDARLDMRMNQNQRLDAWFVLNRYTKDKLIKIFKQYGEIANPSPVVNKLFELRNNKILINTTSELVNLIKDSFPKTNFEKHPAKQYFQALRIEVNDELNVLNKTLSKVTKVLNIGGRVAIITFHSLEEKVVWDFAKSVSENNAPSYLPYDLNTATFKLITKKPITPTQKEIDENKRSHSAKLFVLEKIK